MKITVEMVLSWSPCDDYSESRLRELLGDGLTPLEVAALDIPIEDRIWALLHEPVFTLGVLRQLACDFAAEALPHWEAMYPTDRRPHEAVRVARAYVVGDASKEELASAQDAAWAAAWATQDATQDAASAAASAAAWATRAAARAARAAARAARAAAWAAQDAAWAAARAARDVAWAARNRQLELIVDSILSS